MQTEVTACLCFCRFHFVYGTSLVHRVAAICIVVTGIINAEIFG